MPIFEQVLGPRPQQLHSSTPRINPMLRNGENVEQNCRAHLAKRSLRGHGRSSVRSGALPSSFSSTDEGAVVGRFVGFHRFGSLVDQSGSVSTKLTWSRWLSSFGSRSSNFGLCSTNFVLDSTKSGNQLGMWHRIRRTRAGAKHQPPSCRPYRAAKRPAPLPWTSPPREHHGRPTSSIVEAPLEALTPQPPHQLGCSERRGVTRQHSRS